MKHRHRSKSKKIYFKLKESEIVIIFIERGLLKSKRTKTKNSTESGLGFWSENLLMRHFFLGAILFANILIGAAKLCVDSICGGGHQQQPVLNAWWRWRRALNSTADRLTQWTWLHVSVCLSAAMRLGALVLAQSKMAHSHTRSTQSTRVSLNLSHLRYSSFFDFEFVELRIDWM